MSEPSEAEELPYGHTAPVEAHIWGKNLGSQYIRTRHAGIICGDDVKLCSLLAELRPILEDAGFRGNYTLADAAGKIIRKSYRYWSTLRHSDFLAACLWVTCYHSEVYFDFEKVIPYVKNLKVLARYLRRLRQPDTAKSRAYLVNLIHAHGVSPHVTAKLNRMRDPVEMLKFAINILHYDSGKVKLLVTLLENVTLASYRPTRRHAQKYLYIFYVRSGRRRKRYLCPEDAPTDRSLQHPHVNEVGRWSKQVGYGL